MTGRRLLPQAYSRHRIRHPLFGAGGASDPHDIAVILLDESPGIAPATLPTAGFLDDRAAARPLDTQIVHACGLWVDARRQDRRASQPGVPRRHRRYSQQGFSALLPSWLKLTSNAALDSGGSCSDDQGAPHSYGGITSNLTVWIAITVDPNCRWLGQGARLDANSARDFFGQLDKMP